MDLFKNLTNQESQKKVDDFFNELEYIEKLRVILRFYPKYNISKIEERGIGKLWNSIPLEAKRGIVEDQWKY